MYRTFTTTILALSLLYTLIPSTTFAATTVTLPQYSFLITEVRYVSATGGSASGATVSVTNNNVGVALVSAKQRPYNSLERAISGVGAGTVIIAGPGTYNLSEQLTLSAQGTANQPIILLSEVDRAAVIRSGTGTGRNGRAITLLGGNHWQVHNFTIEGRPAICNNQGTFDCDSNPIQIVGGGTNVTSGAILIAGNHITGRTSDDMIKGTTARGVRIVGNRIEASTPADESGIDFVSIFDFEVSRNTFRGTYGAGGAFQAKGGSQRGMVFRNDFEITPPVGLVLGAGGAGGSRILRDMPFENPVDDYRWAEAHEIMYLENRIAPNTTRQQTLISLQGVTNISFVRNFIDGNTGQTAFREQTGQATPWKNQTTQIPSQYSPYVTFNGSQFTYQSRNNSYRGNRWTAGMTGFANVRDAVVQIDNTAGNSPFTGGVGENTWDRGAIYRALSLPVTTPTTAGQLPPPDPTTPCGDYQNPTTPTGYGSAYNHFSTTKEKIVSAACASTGFTPIIGSSNTTDANFAVYNQGYYWTGTRWQSYTYTPTPGGGRASTQNPGWILGDATTTRIPYQGATTYFVAYTCHFGTTSSPKCGCSDATCATPKWQLQGVTRP